MRIERLFAEDPELVEIAFDGPARCRVSPDHWPNTTGRTAENHHSRCGSELHSYFQVLRFKLGSCKSSGRGGQENEKTIAMMMLLGGGLFAAPHISVGIGFGGACTRRGRPSRVPRTGLHLG